MTAAHQKRNAPGGRKLKDLKDDPILGELFAEEPELDAFELGYYSSFWDLDTHRITSIGFGIAHWNSIPVNEIWRYATDRGYAGEARLDFVRIIRGLDSTYTSWHRKEQERVAKDPPKGKLARPQPSSKKPGRDRMNRKPKQGPSAPRQSPGKKRSTPPDGTP